MTLDLYTMQADLLRALAHPLRLRIVDLLLSQGEKCVCEIVRAVDATQSTVSKHLAVLKDAGVLESRKAGLMVFYRVRTCCVGEFFRCVDRVLADDLRAKQAQLNQEGRQNGHE